MTELLIQRRTVSRRENGVELVRAVFSWPVSMPMANDWITAAERWLDDTLAPYAKREFDEDTGEDKRFFFRRFEYALSISLSPVSKELAECRICASLTRNRGQTVAEKECTELVRLSNLSFVPPVRRKRKKAPRKMPSTSLS